MEQSCENKIWTSVQVSEEVRFFQIGPLRLWYKFCGKELWTTCDRKGEELCLEDTLIPENATWSRWALNEKTESLQFKPTFPDRAITIKPESHLRVAPGAQITVYTRIPIWLRIEREKSILSEIPIVILSKTYFGTYTRGEQCYWISSGIRSSIKADALRPFLAICPLDITNDSKEELLIGKICLRVPELSLYLSENQLWASKTYINFRGSNDISRIVIEKNDPKEIEKAQFISGPRSIEQRKGFAAKTFETLKDVPGLGFLMRYAD